MVAQVVALLNTQRLLRLVVMEILPLLVLLKEIQVVEEHLVEDQLVVVELVVQEVQVLQPDLLPARVVMECLQIFQDHLLQDQVAVAVAPTEVNLLAQQDQVVAELEEIETQLKVQMELPILAAVAELVETVVFHNQAQAAAEVV